MCLILEADPVIERFNKTLTNKLWKQFTIQGNQRMVKYPPKNNIKIVITLFM